MRNALDILAEASLELPVGEKTYKVAPIGYQDGLRIKLAGEALAAGDTDAVPLSDEEFLTITLGPVLEQMRADNLPPMLITRAAVTAWTWSEHGMTVAEHMWEHGPDPEALAASMKAAAASTTSPATDAAGSSTKRPANTSGTSSRKAPAKRPSSRGRS